MKIYYETAHREEGDTYATLTAHETLEAAIEFAEAHGCEIICEIGGSWNEYEKCWLCGEWFSTDQLNNVNLCDRCFVACRDHGG